MLLESKYGTMTEFRHLMKPSMEGTIRAFYNRKSNIQFYNISCELRDAYQNAYQTCTFGSTLVLPWFHLGSISLYLTAINPLPTSTYKPESRTVDPKVEGSSPFGEVILQV